MKSIKFLVFTGLISLSFYACNQTTQQPEHKPVPIERMMEKKGAMISIDLSLLISPKDTICGMNLQDGVADTLTYKGKIYGFCSAGCKESFIQKNVSK